MKKSSSKIAILFILAVGAITALTACTGQSPPEPLSAAIVVGSHANSRNLNFSNADVVDTVRQAVGTYGLVSVISADGVPDLISSNLYDIPEAYKRASAQKLQNDAEKRAGELLGSLSAIKADDEEVDLLESLRLAVRSLSTSPAGYALRIVVIDSGLSTKGLLNFNEMNIAVEPDKAAQYLADLQAIPDFNGITVSWHQLGDTAEPQDSLTPEQRNQLIAIWRAVVEKTGGTFITSDIVPNLGDIKADGMPSVSTVRLDSIGAPVPQTTAKQPATEAIVTAEREHTGAARAIIEPVVFYEQRVRFVADKAIYANSDEAETAVRPTAEFMLANPDFTALIVGTTAGGTASDFAYKLSRDRADTVRDTLVGLGVPAERIMTAGLASSDPWHIPDTGKDGNLNEEAAKLNRKVVLLDASSDTARDVLSDVK